MAAVARATIDDLTQVSTKAELVDGRIVYMPPAGDMPNRGSAKIWASLYAHERHTGGGRAYTDNAGFRVRLPHRESFSPDAAWHIGKPTGMRFLEGAPVFAAEVRSEYDRPKGTRRAAEEMMRRKRADYFAAGTLVVWDVDLLSPDVVKVYRVADPEHPTVYRRGQTAEAEPAVPGWRMAVDELFD